MNTLSRAITARFFPNSDSYNAFRKHWSALINSERKHELSAAHHLLYLALRGKDWRKAFTPPTNPRKVANGAFWGWGLFGVLYTIQIKSKEEELLAPFEGLITPQILEELRNFIPIVSNSYTYTPADFLHGNFPFDAYWEKRDVQTSTLFPEEESNG
jgi:hypothetical protein